MKQYTIFSAALILLPLASTAPTPHAFAVEIFPRGLLKTLCGQWSLFITIFVAYFFRTPEPRKCDPVEFPADPRKLISPMIACAAPRECVPVSDFDIGLDISNVLPKRSAIPEPAPGQHLGIGARTDISTTSPTRPIPEPDEIFKRSRDPLPPPDPDCPNCLGRRSPHWTNGNGPRYDVVEDSGTGVNNGKRDADDAVPDDRSSGVENGILIGSKIKGGSFGGGSGVPPENVVVDDYDTKIGDGIVIGSKLKRRGISGGGGSVPPEGAATEEDGTGNGNEIATECRIKRETVGGGNGAAPAANWGIGNGKEVKERSVIGEGTVLQLGESSVSGDAVFKDWEWRAEMSV